MAFGEQWQAARKAGYTPEQIVEHLKSNPAYGEPVRQALAAGYKPAEIGLHFMGKTSTGAEAGGGTTADNLAAGAGFGMQQAYGNTADKALMLAQNMPMAKDLARAGIDPIGGARQKLQARIDAQKAEAKPLMGTRAGRIGNVAGSVAATLPLVAVPGANTYAGATMLGAFTGGALSDQRDAAGIAKDAAIGAAAGAAGKYVGDKIGAGAVALRDRVAASAAKRAQEQAQKQGAVAAAREAGYVIPPTSANPSMANRAVEGLAGKLTTAQQASTKNQEVTNRLIRKALSIPDDVPLNVDTMRLIRANASQAYGSLRGAGNITADAKYIKSLDDIVSQYQGAARAFPGLANNEVDDLVNSVRQQAFDSDSAVSAIQILRDKADDAFAKGNKSFGKAARAAADSMEGLVERNLAASGQADLLAAFREARQTIAKTYTVEKALNSQTGNVNALKLAQQLAKGKPLSGDIKKAAEFGGAFPKAAQEIKDSMPGVSPLDFYGAGGLAAVTQNPLAMLAIGARPAARSVLLSRPYQAAMLTPGAGQGGVAASNALARIANSDLLRRDLPITAAALTSPLGSQ